MSNKITGFEGQRLIEVLKDYCSTVPDCSVRKNALVLNLKHSTHKEGGKKKICYA